MSTSAGNMNSLSSLEALLAAQRWKDADEATAALVLDSAGAEDYLFAEQAAKLDRSVLDDVDALWRRHSHGRFGFGPQLELWRRADGNQELFATFLGWRRKGVYIGYYSAQFDLSAPEGHLPIGGHEGLVINDVDLDETLLEGFIEIGKRAWDMLRQPKAFPVLAVDLAKRKLMDAERDEQIASSAAYWVGGRVALLEHWSATQR